MYTLDKRVLTDDPMLDAIMHNLRLLLNRTVLKDEDEANKNETSVSLIEGQLYLASKENKSNFVDFKYDRNLLTKSGLFTYKECISYAMENNIIPEEKREPLRVFAQQYFLDNYEEKNNYYRMLDGLPAYNTLGIYITEDMVPEGYRKYFDFSLPLHEFSNYQIAILQTLGILDQVKNDPKFEDCYYLNYLGPNRIDPYDARRALNFQVIYLPQDVEDVVKKRFEELLEKNRAIYTKRFYSSAYKFENKYYDKIIIIMIIAQSATDLITELPEWYIKRNVFDIRTVQFMLESHGIKFFKEIPLKYQISIVRNMNELLKYKSTSRNIFDLCELFGFADAKVFKHYILKKRNINAPNFVESDNLEEKYDLMFIRVPVDGYFDDYARQNINRQTYDTVTTEDPYWDGPYDHNYLKGLMLQKNFVYQATKYLSIEITFNITEYQFQLVYFLNLFMNNRMDPSKLNMAIPSINQYGTFNLRDLFVLLYLVSWNYYDPPTPDTIKNTNTTHEIDDYVYARNEYKGDYELSPDDEIADGGYSDSDPTYDNLPYNMNGGRSLEDKESLMIDANNGFSIDYFNSSDEYDDESNITYNKDLDADGAFSLAFNEYDNMDGGYSDSREYDQFINSGHAKNVYLYPEHFNKDYNKTSDEYRESWLMDDVMEYPFISADNRLLGFNMEADLNYLAQCVGIRHSVFGFTKGYTLEELGVAGFKLPSSNTYKDIEEVLDIYKTDKAIYEHVKSQLLTADNYDIFKVYQFVYDYLFTMDWEQQYLKIMNMEKGTYEFPETYSEYLENKDIILYDYFKKVMLSESDLTTRQYNIGEYVDKIVDSMNEYLSTDMLKYIFTFVPSQSWAKELYWMSLLVNFFKTYKAYMMDIFATINLDDEFDNSARPKDNIEYSAYLLEKGDKASTAYDQFTGEEIAGTKVDSLNVNDRLITLYDYRNKYLDMNGANSKDREYYLFVDGNPVPEIDGNSEYHFNVDVYDDWDGGTSDGLYREEDYQLTDADGKYSEEIIHVNRVDLDGKYSDITNESLLYDVDGKYSNASTSEGLVLTMNEYWNRVVNGYYYSLEEALNEGNAIWRKAHGYNGDTDDNDALGRNAWNDMATPLDDNNIPPALQNAIDLWGSMDESVTPSIKEDSIWRSFNYDPSKLPDYIAAMVTIQILSNIGGRNNIWWNDLSTKGEDGVPVQLRNTVNLWHQFTGEKSMDQLVALYPMWNYINKVEPDAEEYDGQEVIHTIITTLFNPEIPIGDIDGGESFAKYNYEYVDLNGANAKDVASTDSIFLTKFILDWDGGSSDYRFDANYEYDMNGMRSLDQIIPDDPNILKYFDYTDGIAEPPKDRPVRLVIPNGNVGI